MMHIIEPNPANELTNFRLLNWVKMLMLISIMDMYKKIIKKLKFKML